MIPDQYSYSRQDKARESELFSNYASRGEYSAFTEEGGRALLKRCLELGGFKPGSLILDLGCGSGIFTRLLHDQGFHTVGLDLCHPLVAGGLKRNPDLHLAVGDAELLPFRSNVFDGVLFSGLIHHLPDPSLCVRESYRVLKTGRSFVAFDPNRRNPFLWLFRDRSSPFYSGQGVSVNERPIVAQRVAKVFSDAGFIVATDYISVAYRDISVLHLRWALPLYNRLELMLFKPAFAKPYRAFTITHGVKR